MENVWNDTKNATSYVQHDDVESTVVAFEARTRSGIFAYTI